MNTILLLDNLAHPMVAEDSAEPVGHAYLQARFYHAGHAYLHASFYHAPRNVAIQLFDDEGLYGTLSINVTPLVKGAFVVCQDSTWADDWLCSLKDETGAPAFARHGTIDYGFVKDRTVLRMSRALRIRVYGEDC